MLFWHEMQVGTVYYSNDARLTLNLKDVQAAIGRYERADWGEVCQRLADRNPDGVVHGGQVVGLYRDRNDNGFWIITEPAHLETHIKLESEPWEEC